MRMCKGVRMSFALPTFNLLVNVWRFSYAPPDLPILTVNGNLTPGPRSRVGDTARNPASPPSPLMYLLLPSSTVIYGDVDSLGNPDMVEVPAGSGRFYTVHFVDNVATGFPNQYVLCELVRIGKFPPVPAPTMTMVYQNALINTSLLPAIPIDTAPCMMMFFTLLSLNIPLGTFSLTSALLGVLPITQYSIYLGEGSNNSSLLTWCWYHPGGADNVTFVSTPAGNCAVAEFLISNATTLNASFEIGGTVPPITASIVTTAPHLQLIGLAASMDGTYDLSGPAPWVPLLSGSPFVFNDPSGYPLRVNAYALGSSGLAGVKTYGPPDAGGSLYQGAAQLFAFK